MPDTTAIMAENTMFVLFSRFQPASRALAEAARRSTRRRTARRAKR